MKQILFISNIHRRFVALDEEILRTRYSVKSVYVEKRDLRLFFNAWRQTRNVDLILAWFASWHSLPYFLVARLRHIPCLLITGGYDVANEPEINYGLRQGGISKLISGLVFRLANRTLPFSEFSYHEALKNTPLSAEKTSAVHLGLPDSSVFEHPVAKERLAITIGGIDASTAYRKGIRLFVEAAQNLPDVPFIVVGKAYDGYIDELRRIAPANVQFTGYLSNDELIALQQRAKVYVQASHHEGFGLSVAESMLARCVPVVTRRAALPEVVGETGVYVDHLTPAALGTAIRIALESDPAVGETARQRILERFSLDKRSQALYVEVDRLLT